MNRDPCNGTNRLSASARASPSGQSCTSARVKQALTTCPFSSLTPSKLKGIDDMQHRFAYKHIVKRSQVFVEALTGIKKVDLGVHPDPGTLLIGLVMPYGLAQDHDVLKEPLVGAFEQVQDENCLSTSHLPAYRRRMSRLRQEVNKPLRRTGHLRY